MARLNTLNLQSLSIDDAGLDHLKGLDRLKVVSLIATNIGDAGLSRLETLPRLEKLYLNETGVGDAGMAHVAKLAKLDSLGLAKTRVGNAGLAHLEGLGGLEALDLAETDVDDAGLAHLEKLTGLKYLTLDRTKVSEEGLERLARARPSVEIEASMLRGAKKPIPPGLDPADVRYFFEGIAGPGNSPLKPDEVEDPEDRAKMIADEYEIPPGSDPALRRRGDGRRRPGAPANPVAPEGAVPGRLQGPRGRGSTTSRAWSAWSSSASARIRRPRPASPTSKG